MDERCGWDPTWRCPVQARIAELEAERDAIRKMQVEQAYDLATAKALLREVSPSCSMYLRERIEAALDPA